jgi:hypothetical protein
LKNGREKSRPFLSATFDFHFVPLECPDAYAAFPHSRMMPSIPSCGRNVRTDANLWACLDRVVHPKSMDNWVFALRGVLREVKEETATRHDDYDDYGGPKTVKRSLFGRTFPQNIDD